MRFPVVTDWDAWGVPEGLPRYFVLVWEEMLDSETLDTWQVRTLNTRLAIDELNAAVETALRYDVYRRHVAVILQETYEVARVDTVVKRSHPMLLKFLAPFVNAKPRDIDLGALRKRVHVGREMLRDYWSECVALLKESLRGEAKEKRLVWELAHTIGSDACGRGMSPGHLKLLGGGLKTPGSDFAQRVDVLLAACSSAPLSYTCVMALPPMREARVGALDSDTLTVTEDVPEFRSDETLKPFFLAPEHGSTLYAKVQVKAHSDDVAHRLAIGEVERAMAAACLIAPSRGSATLAKTVIVKAGDGGARLIKQDVSRREYVQDATDSATRVRRLVGLLGRVSSGDRERLFAALQHHRLALSAPSDETMLLNLWIALECLAQAGEGNALKRICTVLPPALALRNSMLLVRNLAIYLRTLGKSVGMENLLIHLGRSQRKRVDPLDVLEILLARDGDPRLNGIYRLCVDNPLLTDRIWKLRHEVFLTPKHLVERLERNRRDIHWQVRRIYRTRNELVHRGWASLQVNHLVQHLHTYLVQAIHSVAYDLEQSGERWSIDDALEYRVTLYGEFAAALKSSSAGDITPEILLNPGLLLRPARGERAWPGESGASAPKKGA